MKKTLIAISLSCLSPITAFDNASDFFDDLGGSEQLVAYAKPNSNGAAKFPNKTQQSDKDRWTAAAIAGKEAGVKKPQGQADVLQIILNRIESGKYGCKSIHECVNMKGQFEPTFKNPWAWKSITDLRTAARAANLSINEIKKIDSNLQNIKLQKEAARFVECRTDFNGDKEKPYMQPHNGDITRGKGHNFFGNFYANSGNGRCI